MRLRGDGDGRAGRAERAVLAVHWVGPEGLEPSTRGLKVRCSAN